jgi:hypothetical protein
MQENYLYVHASRTFCEIFCKKSQIAVKCAIIHVMSCYRCHIIFSITWCAFNVHLINFSLEFQEFMKPDNDEFEYYKNIDVGRKNSCETPVVAMMNGQRKTSSPCISLTKSDPSMEASRHQRVNSVPFVRHFSQPVNHLTGKT